MASIPVTTNKQRLEIVYKCDEHTTFARAYVGGDGKRLSFNCEFCGKRLMPSVNDLTLRQHGKTPEQSGHTVRMLRVLEEGDSSDE